MMAARYGTDFAVNTLLTAGADPTLKNEQGLTALDFANQAGNDKVAKTIADAILTIKHIKIDH
jgi:ankyrin repeat protein